MAFWQSKPPHDVAFRVIGTSLRYESLGGSHHRSIWESWQASDSYEIANGRQPCRGTMYDDGRQQSHAAKIQREMEEWWHQEQLKKSKSKNPWDPDFSLDV